MVPKTRNASKLRANGFTIYVYFSDVRFESVFFALNPAVLHAEDEMAVSSGEQIAIIIANLRRNLFAARIPSCSLIK